jgi:hypothetical protein
MTGARSSRRVAAASTRAPARRHGHGASARVHSVNFRRTAGRLAWLGVAVLASCAHPPERDPKAGLGVPARWQSAAADAAAPPSRWGVSLGGTNLTALIVV